MLMPRPRDIDAILAIEQASFTNPWTREMYLAELENDGVSFFYLARDARRLVVGFCSFWRVLDELHINNLAVAAEPAARRRGDGAADAACLPTARRSAPVARRSRCAGRTMPARLLYERFGFSVAGVRPRLLHASPIEDALVLWRRATGA